MDKYYQTDEFQAHLHAYEEMRKGNIGDFLDSEDLTDIAEYYHLKGMEKERNEVLDYAVDLYPGAASPLIFQARIALLMSHDIDAAERIADAVEDKEHLEYIYFQIELMLNQGKYEEANRYMHEHINATEDEEEREDYILDMACFFLDYDDVDRAEEWLKLVSDKTSDMYKELRARSLKALGRYDESEGLYNTLIDGDPYSGKYWNQLAQSQILHKDFLGAISSSEYAIAIDPNDEEAVLNKATALFANNNPDEALKYYLRYKELNPQTDTSFVDITIGHILLAMNKEDEGRTYFQQGYESAEDKQLAMLHIAISAFENGYIQYAHDIFKVILDSDERVWSFGYGYLARCCYELNLLDEFNIYLRIGVERCPNECQDLLSDLYPENTAVEDYPNIPLMDFLSK